MKGRRDRGMVRTEVQEVSARGCRGGTSSLAPFRSGLRGWGGGWSYGTNSKHITSCLMWHTIEIKVEKQIVGWSRPIRREGRL